MEILGIFFKSVIEFIAGLVPGLLLRGHYTESRLEHLVEIDLRTTNPVTITNQTVLPEVNVYLRVTNFLPFEVKLTHGVIDVWLGQPLAKQIALPRSIVIPAHATNSDVFFTAMLADNQIAFATAAMENAGPGKVVSVSGALTFETRIRGFVKAFIFERRDREADAALWFNRAKLNA
jgi:hypothetical protein